jgi:tetratricopeptide (TPR) repeat protein
MLRGFFPLIVALAAAGPALAAGDIDTCRDAGAEPAPRLVACESVVADDKITGKSKAAAFGYVGDALNKKRDYDGAIAAFSKAYEADPDNVSYVNSRGIAYSNKGDDEHALADYDLCLQTRPKFASPYNNRGLIFMRNGDLQRALGEFNSAVQLSGNNPSRYIQLSNRARLQTLLKQYDAALADFAEAQKVNPNWPIASNRCVTYTEMGKFDEALADCNDALAKAPNSVFTLTSRGKLYLAKGDLDAALKDYNEALKIGPNNIRARAARGQLYEKRRDFSAARSDYRSASAALTKVDDTDTAIARRFAKERLAALMAALPAPSSFPPKPAPGNAAAPALPPGPRKVALIIGNGAYKNVQQLENPPRDARLIASTFRELGFATVTLAPDLSRDKFFAALHEFGAEAEKSDWAVIYYAGHGMEVGGVNYLIPTDAKLAADRDAETQAVALEQVIAAVSGARKLRLVLLDACRDNPFEKTMQHTIALKLVSKGFSNIEPEAGFMVVYAAKHGETALDGEGQDSPFATMLARDIKEPEVEVRKLFDIVRDDVWNATRHRQQPFIYGSPPGREDFSWRGSSSQSLMVRRRACAVSNHEAPMWPILRDAGCACSSG